LGWEAHFSLFGSVTTGTPICAWGGARASGGVPGLPAPAGPSGVAWHRHMQPARVPRVLSSPAEHASTEGLRAGGADLAGSVRTNHGQQSQEGSICEVLWPFRPATNSDTLSVAISITFGESGLDVLCPDMDMPSASGYRPPCAVLSVRGLE